MGIKFPLRLDYGRSPHTYVNQTLQIQLELLMMSGVPLEKCCAFNEWWNNKLYYKVASGWLFLLSTSDTTQDKNICNILGPPGPVICTGFQPSSPFFDTDKSHKIKVTLQILMQDKLCQNQFCPT
jgi:hypothetical protein